MVARFISIINGAVGVAAIYLLVVYGKLHWWYRDAKQSSLDTSALRSNFLSAADQLPFIAIVVAALAALANFALWKSKLIDRKWGIALLCVSLFCLALSLVLRF